MIRQSSRPALRRQTTASLVTHWIRSRIISGAFAPGTRLRQDELARELGTSIIPVRESFAHLESERFVTIAPHFGAVVAPISVDDARELLELRALLECRLLATAIPNFGDAELEHAEVALAKLHPAGRSRRGSVEEHWGEMNWQFHHALYQPAAMPRTLAIVQQLHLHTERYTHYQMSLKGRTERAKTQHRELLELARRRDSDAALAALEDHILNALDDLQTAAHEVLAAQPPHGSARRVLVR